MKEIYEMQTQEFILMKQNSKLNGIYEDFVYPDGYDDENRYNDYKEYTDYSDEGYKDAAYLDNSSDDD